MNEQYGYDPNSQQYTTGKMNADGEYHYTYQHIPPQQNSTSQQKPHHKTPQWLTTICLALLFGITAASAFIGVNYITGRLFNTENNESASVVFNDSNLSESTSNSNGTSIPQVRANSMDVSAIAANTLPSIVAVTNMSIQDVQSWFGGRYQQEVESMGSGIIIAQNDTELLIVTNNHVIEDSQALTVTFIDDESVSAVIKGTDPDLDVAVISVSLTDMPNSTKNNIAIAAIGNSTDLQVGEPVIAIGNALGYGQSVTAGIVSALGRQITGYNGFLIQTDAAINPGNSGGALLNANGEVIGINVAKLASEEIEGMSYAIPISDAYDVIENLMAQETREQIATSKQGYLGITGYDVTSDSAQLYNMPKGLYISSVMQGSGAEAAGLAKGMIITKLNETKITGMESMQNELLYHEVGETVVLTVETPDNTGNYIEQIIDVTLGELR